MNKNDTRACSEATTFETTKNVLIPSRDIPAPPVKKMFLGSYSSSVFVHIVESMVTQGL